LPVNASRNVPESMGVGIDETMAGGDISRRPHPHEAEGGATRMRFVHTLMQLRKSIADIREAVHFAAEGIFQMLVGQYLELGEHLIHATLVNRVKPVRRGGYRRETDFVEAQIVLQVPEDSNHIGDTRGQGDTCRDRTSAMILNQRAYP